ncbi:MAG: hypothetical protein R2911_42160 [Caldilineaceae bacterium]
MLTAVELTGHIDESRQLHLDNLLPIRGPQKVRVIVLYAADDEWDEQQWLQAAARNPVFDFLNDPEEDIYSLEDGEPFHAQI